MKKIDEMANNLLNVCAEIELKSLKNTDDIIQDAFEIYKTTERIKTALKWLEEQKAYNENCLMLWQILETISNDY